MIGVLQLRAARHLSGRSVQNGCRKHISFMLMRDGELAELQTRFDTEGGVPRIAESRRVFCGRG
jgi:hypothetical protein